MYDYPQPFQLKGGSQEIEWNRAYIFSEAFFPYLMFQLVVFVGRSSANFYRSYILICHHFSYISTAEVAKCDVHFASLPVLCSSSALLISRLKR